MSRWRVDAGRIPPEEAWGPGSGPGRTRPVIGVGCRGVLRRAVGAAMIPPCPHRTPSRRPRPTRPRPARRRGARCARTRASVARVRGVRPRRHGVGHRPPSRRPPVGGRGRERGARARHGARGRGAHGGPHHRGGAREDGPLPPRRVPRDHRRLRGHGGDACWTGVHVCGAGAFRGDPPGARTSIRWPAPSEPRWCRRWQSCRAMRRDRAALGDAANSATLFRATPATCGPTTARRSARWRPDGVRAWAATRLRPWRWSCAASTSAKRRPEAEPARASAGRRQSMRRISAR